MKKRLIAFTLIILASVTATLDAQHASASFEEITSATDTVIQEELENASLNITAGTRMISAGNEFTVVVKHDASLWIVGHDIVDLFNSGNTDSKAEFIKVMDDVKFVSAGDFHCLAIKNDGSLWGWRVNFSGQLSSESVRGFFEPQKIMDDVIYASTGTEHSMAIKTDGSLWAWGSNRLGRLGDGTDTSRSSPVKIMDHVAMVSAGEAHTMAIKTDGSLWVWGSNFNAQIGDGSLNIGVLPVKVMEDVVYISAGGMHSLAVQSDGSLWAWGNNDFGQLGDGSTETRQTPVKIMDDIASVSAGQIHSAAIATDGTLWTWGRNEYWEIGIESEKNHFSPVMIMEGVVSVAAGTFHTKVIGLDDYVWGRGYRGFGIAEGRTVEESRFPVRIFDMLADSEAGSELSWNKIVPIILILILPVIVVVIAVVIFIVNKKKNSRDTNENQIADINALEKQKDEEEWVDFEEQKDEEEWADFEEQKDAEERVDFEEQYPEKAKQHVRTCKILNGIGFAYYFLIIPIRLVDIFFPISTTIFSFGAIALFLIAVFYSVINNHTKLSLINALLAPGLFFVYTALTLYPIVYNLRVLMAFLSIAFIISAIMLFAARERNISKSTLISLLVFVFIFSYGASVTVNCELDFSDPQANAVYVISKSRGSSNTPPTIVVEFFLDGTEDRIRIPVSRDEYNNLNAGDVFFLNTKPGHLGIRWVPR
ncbi:MAG: hypothetical protein LBD23_19010 [Oscillospiraceae bacterium]|jgi:alpha-tubulin suppressor-like RCC1 family protein|nr:hypothetical protein [Oscillospiraceae bacterium]